MVRVRPQTAQDLVNRVSQFLQGLSCLPIQALTQRFSVELSRDPLTAALKPPENETMADKRYRLALEQVGSP